MAHRRRMGRERMKGVLPHLLPTMPPPGAVSGYHSPRVRRRAPPPNSRFPAVPRTTRHHPECLRCEPRWSVNDRSTRAALMVLRRRQRPAHEAPLHIHVAVPPRISAGFAGSSSSSTACDRSVLSVLAIPRTGVERLAIRRDTAIALRVYAHWLPQLSGNLVDLLDDGRPAASQAHPEPITQRSRVAVSRLFGVVSQEGIEPSTRRLRVCCSAN